MRGKLKSFLTVAKECHNYYHKEGSHYWKFFYETRNLEKNTLGFRNFYWSYFGQIVKIIPKLMYNLETQAKVEGDFSAMIPKTQNSGLQELVAALQDQGVQNVVII